MPFATFKSRKDPSPLRDTMPKTKRFGSFGRSRDGEKLISNGSITSVESPSGHNEVEIPLLAQEGKCYSIDGSPISTLTWFQGNPTEAARILETRSRDIVIANPWLGGRISKRKGKAVLVHPESYEDTDSESESCASHGIDNFTQVTNSKKTSLHRIVGIEEIADLCKPYLVQNGPKKLLWKITFVPCSEFPNQYFAVIHSMSHVISDASTYYCIHNMLLADATIKPLSPQRIAKTEDMQKQFLGRKEFGVLDTPIFLTGLLSGAIKLSAGMTSSMTSAKNKKRFFLVDNEQLQQETAGAMTADVFAGVPTNEVLTSWFFQQTECVQGILGTNMRNLLVGHTSDHAGNYENTLIFDPKQYSSPQLIRNTVCDPSLWQRQPKLNTKGRISLVSDWAILAQNCRIPGCQEELHLPLFLRPKYPLSSNLSAAVIFRAGPGKTAMYVVGNSKVMQTLESASLVSDQHLE